ncbi:phage integrase N-terminal SAM-like domain-containing protein [Rhodoferax sp. U11-2br]|uniref:phage integrase N-terminal SAM-like domain-containing protein n=1 Tax=Rhodoferax sp. U11-2br TaxID=2838878 RepID=UPI001BE6174F|nr:phage integrase N-terminal SAM-like domain-containing protein [Rhodoferax sp. U11-2br]
MSWINNFTLFHSLKHLRNIGQADIESFLTFLATQRKVSVLPHRQATITPVMFS